MLALAEPHTLIDANGPDGMTLHAVIGSSSPLLTPALDLFEHLFPDYVRYAPYVRACADERHPEHPARVDHVWLALKDGQPAGLYVFCYIHTCRVGFGAFVGVSEEYRHTGLAAWLLRRIHTQLDEDASRFGHPPCVGYMGEIEREEEGADAADQRERRRRVLFMQHYGHAFRLPVDYTEPVVCGGASYYDPALMVGVLTVPMHLLFFPSRPLKSLPPQRVREMVEGLYLDYYRVGADSPLYLNAMRSLGSA